jgi:hypothetical protein
MDKSECPCDECIVGMMCTQMCQDALPYFKSLTKKRNLFEPSERKMNIFTSTLEARKMKVSDYSQFIDEIVEIKNATIPNGKPLVGSLVNYFIKLKDTFTKKGD